MKNIDVKSLIIGALLTSTIFLGVAATSPTDKWDEKQEWLYASEAAGRVADSAVQIHGAMGYACDLAVERLYRDARLYRIAEGTSEIQKNLIARNLLA